jgi:hypothetical protein
VEKVRDLLNVPASKVKVLSAAGAENVSSSVEAVRKVLKPVVTRDSPYANRVVAMIDRPPSSSPLDDLRRVLGDRLFVLNEPSIEEYLPQGVYAKAGRNKADDVERMRRLRNDYPQLMAFKKDLSERIAAHLAAEDLESLRIIVSAVQKASS